ncbi:MAG: radical SAM protein [Candidatus Omnitrophica bacterium]|nr:radical SAM protein [Candidatus Omnitrophota bacterium]
MRTPKRFLRVYMDLNNKCNLKCRMCYFALDLKKTPPVVMGIPLFKKIAGQVFSHALSVNLSCSAEPFMIPHFPEAMAIAKRYKVPVTQIVTNAQLLDEEKIRAVIDAGITILDVSIDAATKRTYESIRKGASFERWLTNVKLLQAMKKKMKKRHPLLYLDYSLMKCNIGEFPAFLELAKGLKADSVRANHLIPFKRLHLFKESLVHLPEETNRIFDRSRRLARKLKLDLNLPENFPLKTSSTPVINKPGCRTPFESLDIMSDGRVTPCTWFSFKEWCAGDFRTQTFEEIWNGPVYKKLRGLFESGRYTPYCVNCPVYGNEALGPYVFRERAREDVINISADGV